MRLWVYFGRDNMPFATKAESYCRRSTATNSGQASPLLGNLTDPFTVLHQATFLSPSPHSHGRHLLTLNKSSNGPLDSGGLIPCDRSLSVI
jgi:hypothetical protein